MVDRKTGINRRVIVFYAVKSGRKTGIFNTWDECKEQVHGYKNAVYKKFKSYDDALAFIELISGEKVQNKNTHEIEAFSECEPVLTESSQAMAYVDGSYNIKTKKVGYGVVFFSSEGKKEISDGKIGDYSQFRNVAGEIFAAMNAIDTALNFGKNKLTIYYDYAGIRHWALGEWKRNNQLTKSYYEFYQQIKNKITVEFKKVEAHTGVYWNEVADTLAKRGCGID